VRARNATVARGHVLTTHFFSVDVEEYFHVSAFERVISRSEWPAYPRRLTHTMPRLLDQLARHGVSGTFFVLGWVAEHSPEIVRDILRAGHEIASHGYGHQRVTTLTPSQFRADVRAAKAILEQITGEPVYGYRAPSFSIGPDTPWAFAILAEEGYRYDSSLLPVRRRNYGYPSATREPHVIRSSAGSLQEFPLATASLGRLHIPAAGGGYLRQLPYWIVHRAFAQAEKRGVPATFYIHPWEIDPDQPRVRAPLVTRMRHYRGLAGTFARLERLLEEFRFTSMATYARAEQTRPAVSSSS